MEEGAFRQALECVHTTPEAYELRDMLDANYPLETLFTITAIYLHTINPPQPHKHLHKTPIVHLPHIHQLLPPRAGDILRDPLVQQRLHRRFDGVHGVSRAGDARGEVVDAGAFADFVDEVLAADPEAYHVSRQPLPST